MSVEKSKKRGNKSPKKNGIEKQIFNDAEDGNEIRLNKLLKDTELEFNINWANPKENGDTPLHVAAKWDRSKVVELLLANGATVDKVNNDNQTPLMVSILHNYKDTTAEILIKNGADINKMDNFGRKPIHMACRKYGIPVLVKLLIKNGANVNEPEQNAFNTPLHFAAMNHTDFGYLGSNKGNETNEEIATILLENGADPELKNAKGQTVMELAESRRNHWVVEILENFPKKKLYKATIGILRQPTNSLNKSVLGLRELNANIKGYLGGKNEHSGRSKRSGIKTRKGTMKKQKKNYALVSSIKSQPHDNS